MAQKKTRIAIVGRAVGGVHQEGFPARRDDQGGGAAFGVNPVDVQGFRGGEPSEIEYFNRLLENVAPMASLTAPGPRWRFR